MNLQIFKPSGTCERGAPMYSQKDIMIVTPYSDQVDPGVKTVSYRIQVPGANHTVGCAEEENRAWMGGNARISLCVNDCGICKQRVYTQRVVTAPGLRRV